MVGFEQPGVFDSTLGGGDVAQDNLENNVTLSDEEDRIVEKIEGSRDSWSKMSLQ